MFFNSGIEHHVKALTYADDICIALDGASVLLVSNTKFKQGKTNAFTLSSCQAEPYITFLEQHDVAFYSTDRSSEPFSYLESSIIFTANQRKLVEDQLLTKVQYQAQVYSQCQISLKGCATVMSILLLSSVVTIYKSFFNELQNAIYVFVWQHKRPPISFDQLCLPIAQGSLDILSPR